MNACRESTGAVATILAFRNDGSVTVVRIAVKEMTNSLALPNAPIKSLSRNSVSIFTVDCTSNEERVIYSMFIFSPDAKRKTVAFLAVGVVMVPRTVLTARMSAIAPPIKV